MQIQDNQKTKIIATLGPASSSHEVLKQLVYAGVDTFRLNFSHGSHSDHLEVINLILKVNKELDVHVGIIADLQGPKIRIGKVQEGGIPIKDGDEISFVGEECIGNSEKVFMKYDHFASDVVPGDRVLCDDGKIVFEVMKTDKKSKVQLKVVHGGILHSNKGVNLPDTTISLPSLTKKDLEDLDFILGQPVNWIALSFVRTAEDVKQLVRMIEEKGHEAKVIAKIEKPQAVKNIKEIIKASNGIMIARGDLGVEVPMEKVPTIQKNIIRRCIQRARTVIVATQMMDSMIVNPSPTRAEVTDVANAVLDGTDAVMLSGETSVGKFPVETVRAMNKIITEAERYYEWRSKRPKPNPGSSTYYSDVMCLTAARTAEDIKAETITALTVSGYSAYKISSFRPKTRICIFSKSHSMLRTLNLAWGVRCFHYDRFSTTDETFEDLIEILKTRKIVDKGDVIVNTGSMPINRRFRTNMMKITIIE